MMDQIKNKVISKEVTPIERLIHCPYGTKLYCTLYGEAIFCGVHIRTEPHANSINLSVKKVNSNGVINFYCLVLNADGSIMDSTVEGECVLFPSRTNRDWSTVDWRNSIPEDTWVMYSTVNDPNFHLGKYFSGDMVKTISKNPEHLSATIIIPYDRFDPQNINQSMKSNIVE